MIIIFELLREVDEELNMEVVLKLLLILVTISTFSFADPNYKNIFRQTKKEVQNEALNDVTGHVPKWLSGDFVRQNCASYGEIDGRSLYIDLSFDN